MDHAVVLIADPARAPLPARALERMAALHGARARWLADDAAFEAIVDDDGLARFRAGIDGALEGVPADIAVLPAAGREKALLVSDMDSTMITVECIDELADLVGRRSEVARITRRAMNGELDFEGALDARVALLAGLRVDVLDEVFRTRALMMPGARTLIATMRARGARTVLVSGGFAAIVDRVAAHLGFHRAVANRLEIAGSTLTGRVLRPVLGSGEKLAVLREERERLRIGQDRTLAIGDGANDLPMLQESGLGVAFRAHPAVRAAVPVSIAVGDLTAILHLQGIPASAFVAR